MLLLDVSRKQVISEYALVFCFRGSRRGGRFVNMKTSQVKVTLRTRASAIHLSSTCYKMHPSAEATVGHRRNETRLRRRAGEKVKAQKPQSLKYEATGPIAHSSEVADSRVCLLGGELSVYRMAVSLVLYPSLFVCDGLHFIRLVHTYIHTPSLGHELRISKSVHQKTCRDQRHADRPCPCRALLRRIVANI